MEEWLHLRSCAAELLEAGRLWWPAASPGQRAALGPPLKKLAEDLAALDSRSGMAARPMVPMLRRGFLTDCRAVVDRVRRTVPPDGAGERFWSGAARLAYVLATVEVLET